VAASLTLSVLLAARLYHPDDAPFSPSSDSEVIEHVVSAAESGHASSELQALEAALARSPNDAQLAVRVARQHLDAARITGDAGRLSYAEAALAAWSTGPGSTVPSPPAVVVLRATIEQARAVLLGGVGDLGGDEGSARLATLLHRPGITESDAQRARSVLGEGFLYRGDVAAAERELRAAFNADPTDVYTRSLLADLLLDSDRAAEVMKLIGETETNDMLRLRRAIAADRMKAPDAPVLRNQLRARFDELRARGDSALRREEARFALSVEHDAAAALPLAAADFEQRREPWDARLLVESAAALAAHTPARRAEAVAAAQPALDWIGKTHCAWPPVARAAASLTGAR
jgi:hypothetical protein